MKDTIYTALSDAHPNDIKKILVRGAAIIGKLSITFNNIHQNCNADNFIIEMNI